MTEVHILCFCELTFVDALLKERTTRYFFVIIIIELRVERNEKKRKKITDNNDNKQCCNSTKIYIEEGSKGVHTNNTAQQRMRVQTF